MSDLKFAAWFDVFRSVQALRAKVMAPLTAEIARSFRPLAANSTRQRRPPRHTSPMQRTRPLSNALITLPSPEQPLLSVVQLSSPASQRSLSPLVPSPSRLSTSASASLPLATHHASSSVSAPPAAAAAFDEAFAHLNLSETQELEQELERALTDGEQGVSRSSAVSLNHQSHECAFIRVFFHLLSEWWRAGAFGKRLRRRAHFVSFVSNLGSV